MTNSDANGHKFLGIFTEADTKYETAVIIAHGMSVHPKWPDVIYPLRVGLPENGIATLSIQMPILGKDADPATYVPLFAEVPDLIIAEINHLRALSGSTDISSSRHCRQLLR